MNLKTSLSALILFANASYGQSKGRKGSKSSKMAKNASNSEKRCSEVYYRDIVTSQTLTVENILLFAVGERAISSTMIVDQIAPGVNATTFTSVMTCTGMKNTTDDLGVDVEFTGTFTMSNEDGSKIVYRGDVVSRDFLFHTSPFARVQLNTDLAVIGGTGSFIGAYGELHQSCDIAPPPSEGCEFRGIICRSDEGMAAL